MNLSGRLPELHYVFTFTGHCSQKREKENKKTNIIFAAFLMAFLFFATTFLQTPNWLQLNRYVYVDTNNRNIGPTRLKMLNVNTTIGRL